MSQLGIQQCLSFNAAVLEDSVEPAICAMPLKNLVIGKYT